MGKGRGVQFVTLGCGVSLVSLLIAVLPATAAPTVFWVSEPVQPGEVVLLYGGGLGEVREVTVRRLADEAPGVPPPQSIASEAEAVRVPTLQPSDSSLKFMLPAGMSTGVFAVAFGGGPRLINVPKVEWCQPTRLLPGLNENEAAPGATVQIIGRNCLLDESLHEKVKVALRGQDGRILWLKVVRAEKYAIVAELPADLSIGEYQVWVHNGSGGPAGWGSGTSLTIKRPTAWPVDVFNIKDFGAQGNDVTDDSEAFRRALAAAEQNGGGTVYCPAGMYRLTGWFRLPKRVVLRGEGTDITWLKWPQTKPQSVADFIPAVLYGAGEYGLENLSLMVRNARIVLRDLSFDSLLHALYNAPAPIPEMGQFMRPMGETRDIFLRHVRIHYLPNAGRPSHSPESDPQWQFNRWGIINSANDALTVAMGGVRNLEVSDCEFVGSQRFLDFHNARLVESHFSNQMGVSWTDLGGQYVVFAGNRLIGASSWRAITLPLRYLYCAHNFSVNIERGEREALTFDLTHAGAKGLLGRPGRSPVEAWQGKVASATATAVQLLEADLPPEAYQGFEMHIVSGTGAGQYRTVASNTAGTVTIAPPWDVLPDATSVVLIHRLMGHCILYQNSAEDASVLFQIWGDLYDVILDSNTVKRSQGMWGLAGWFVQWLNNQLDVAVTYHSRIGPAGNTPEGNAEYGYIGFTIEGRITTLGIPFAYVRGCVVRGNRLAYGHRVLIMRGYYSAERKQVNFVTARDVVIDHNTIDHTPVGIELDANTEGAVIANNVFTDVKEPLKLYNPQRVFVLGAP